MLNMIAPTRLVEFFDNLPTPSFLDRGPVQYCAMQLPCQPDTGHRPNATNPSIHLLWEYSHPKDTAVTKNIDATCVG